MDLQAAVEQAAATFRGRHCRITETGDDHERTRIGQFVHAVNTTDAHGMAVRMVFDAETLELSGARVASAEFDRGGLKIAEKHSASGGPRNITVALAGSRRPARPEPEPAANPHVANVDAALALFAWRWRGHQLLVRDPRQAGGFETGGKFAGVTRDARGWVVLAGDHQVRVPYAGLEGATTADSGRVLSIGIAGLQVVLRAVELDEDRDDQAEMG